MRTLNCSVPNCRSYINLEDVPNVHGALEAEIERQGWHQILTAEGTRTYCAAHPEDELPKPGDILIPNADAEAAASARPTWPPTPVAMAPEVAAAPAPGKPAAGATGSESPPDKVEPRITPKEKDEAKKPFEAKPTAGTPSDPSTRLLDAGAETSKKDDDKGKDKKSTLPPDDSGPNPHGDPHPKPKK